MRKQKRFSTRASVIKEIERVKEFYLSKITEAERLGALATNQFKDSATADQGDAQELIKSAQFNRATSNKLLRQAESQSGKLKILQSTLAAIETEAMPFMGSDPSVVLQR